MICSRCAERILPRPRTSATGIGESSPGPLAEHRRMENRAMTSYSVESPELAAAREPGIEERTAVSARCSRAERNATRRAPAPRS